MSKKLVKSLLASTVRELQSPNGKNGGKRKRGARRRFRKRGASKLSESGILAGYGSALSSSFSQNMVGDGLIVRGLDLLTSSFIPDEADNVHVSFYMNANPANWLGTRISAIATAFQNYRPRKFIIHYRPQVGSTDNRSVFIGTLWQGNMIYGTEALEPSLLTSPGGTYLPSWQSCSTVVPLGDRLPMRMFPVRDPPSSVVPFSVFVRSSTGGPSSVALTMPGRIFIEYEYEFRNAIGPSSSQGVKLPLVRRVCVRYSELTFISGGAIADYAWIFWDEAGNSPKTKAVDGYVVAVSGGPATSLPLGAHIDSDMLQARTRDGGPYMCNIVTVNGERLSGGGAIEGQLLHVYVYTNFGDPLSPVSIPSSSASFVEAFRVQPSH